jgi:hypothetical protein
VLPGDTEFVFDVQIDDPEYDTGDEPIKKQTSRTHEIRKTQPQVNQQLNRIWEEHRREWAADARKPGVTEGRKNLRDTLELRGGNRSHPGYGAFAQRYHGYVGKAGERCN